MRYGEDLDVLYPDPENERLDIDDPARLLTAANGATSSFAVYDEDTEDALTAAASLGASVLTVGDAAQWSDAWALELLQTDGTLHRSEIANIDTGAGTITIDTVTTAAAVVGARVRRIMGVAPYDITMAEYGTPKASDPSWGFAAVRAWDTKGFIPGMTVKTEITFKGDPGGGLQVTRFLCDTLTTDCEEQ